MVHALSSSPVSQSNVPAKHYGGLIYSLLLLSQTRCFLYVCCQQAVVERQGAQLRDPAAWLEGGFKLGVLADSADTLKKLQAGLSKTRPDALVAGTMQLAPSGEPPVAATPAADVVSSGRQQVGVVSSLLS